METGLKHWRITQPARRCRLAALFPFLWALALLLPAFPPTNCAADTPHAETARMVARLKKLHDELGTWDNPWEKNREKAQDLDKRIKAEKDLARRDSLAVERAQQLLYAGDVREAIDALLTLRAERIKRVGLCDDDCRFQGWILAIAYLRLGEMNNCVEHHTTESCLLPLQPAGQHQNKEGASKAEAVLRELLADPQTPDYARAGLQWLYTIAAMTLGEYPDKVPERWRIDPARFQSAHPIPRFPDVAKRAGVNQFGAAGGCILDDFNGDNHLDLIASSWGSADQLEYFENTGNATFERKTAEAGLPGITGGLQTVQADYDNDGDLDLLVLRGAWLEGKGAIPNSLLKNNGSGSFSDVTESTGLLSYQPTQAAVWADFDNDGWLDLLIGNEAPQLSEPQDNWEFYRNERNGHFRRLYDNGIKISGMVKGLAAGDFDNDGWMDFYVSYLGTPNQLYRNLGIQKDGAQRFADVGTAASVTEPLASFPTWFFDYDNDGLLDLLVFGYQATIESIATQFIEPGHPVRGARAKLYHNLSAGRFEDVSKQAGLQDLLLAMGSNYGDLDNDGYLDFYVGTGSPEFEFLVPNKMYRNNAGQSFQDVTTAGGFGHLQKGHGVCFGDYDNDGDQDIYQVVGGAYPSDAFWNTLYENPGTGNNWLTLKLVGAKANRSAIGARLKLVTRLSDGSSQSIYRTISSGSSFGANTLRAEIGLGHARSIELLEIRWPGSGVVQRITNLTPLNSIFEIREGQQPIEITTSPDGSS